MDVSGAIDGVKEDASFFQHGNGPGPGHRLVGPLALLYAGTVHQTKPRRCLQYSVHTASMPEYLCFDASLTLQLLGLYFCILYLFFCPATLCFQVDTGKHLRRS